MLFGTDELRNTDGRTSANIVDLTAATGTGDDTVVDVGGSFAQATLNNNFKDLAVKVNAILAALRAAKIIG